MLIKLLAIVTKISLLLCSTMPSLRFSEKQSPRQCLECYQLFWAVQSREWGWWGTRVRDVILCNAMYCHTSCVLKTGSCAKTDCVALHCLSVWASLETMQKGTKPWCSARKRKRKRNLASRLLLISFLTDEILCPRKWILCIPASLWLLRNLGTMSHSTLFFLGLKVEVPCLHVVEMLAERERKGLREFEKVHNVFLYFSFVCWLLLKHTLRYLTLILFFSNYKI